MLHLIALVLILEWMWLLFSIWKILIWRTLLSIWLCKSLCQHLTHMRLLSLPLLVDVASTCT